MVRVRVTWWAFQWCSSSAEMYYSGPLFSYYFTPYPINWGLKPFWFRVHHVSSTPSNVDPFPDLPAEAVGVCLCNPCLELAFWPLMVLLHMSTYKWRSVLLFPCCLSTPTIHVLLSSCIYVSCCLAYVYRPLVFRAQLTFNFIIDIVSSAVSTFSSLYVTCNAVFLYRYKIQDNGGRRQNHEKRATEVQSHSHTGVHGRWLCWLGCGAIIDCLQCSWVWKRQALIMIWFLVGCTQCGDVCQYQSMAHHISTTHLACILALFSFTASLRQLH